MVLEKLLAGARVIPVASFEDADQAEATARALMAGGVRCLEVTFRTPAAATALARVAAIDGLAVGAGTVRTVEQARIAADAGAQFVLSPCLDAEVVTACRELGLPFVPGVATPSEISAAGRLGFSTVKAFPAQQIGGPAFLRAVSATFPEMRFIPTGGVSVDNLGDYLALDSVAAVGGSWLVAPALLQAGRFDEVERLAREVSIEVPA